MKKPSFSVHFSGPSGTFSVDNLETTSGLYFPLCNEAGLLSAVTPSLHGDIKLDQHTFLNQPVSLEDLHTSRVSRNFWIVTGSLAKNHGEQAWSVTGQSAWQKALGAGAEPSHLEAGFLWQWVERTNKKLGLKASVLSFVPSDNTRCEVMNIEITNAGRKPLRFRAVSAIPLFGRSADNLRDHRHVTSLLHRLSSGKFGLRLCPTMSFNERGHRLNTTSYFVNGVTGTGRPPEGFYPTVASFIGEGGTLDHPAAVFGAAKPVRKISSHDQGQEAMGALAFGTQTLKPGQTASFTLLLGIDPAGSDGSEMIKRFSSQALVREELEKTKAAWEKVLSPVRFQTGNTTFDGWVRWVQLQPTLRKIFGNSFLPDFDYGRGGRGWRDLWQDCLALLLFQPSDVRPMILHNFAGVRMDGSNATIIGTNKEFVADRNNISRTWMDHGTWPYLTAKLYVDQTGDAGLLLENAAYFSGNDHGGTLLEHILVQHLVSFFNVGEHNTLRLEDADWNDGLDMAHDRGESVAFTHLYGANLNELADLLAGFTTKKGWGLVSLAKELGMLLDRCLGNRLDYDSIEAKRARGADYQTAIKAGVRGEKVSIPLEALIADLRAKAEWIKNHLNKNEWVTVDDRRWFNGYYDNNGTRVEGKSDGRVRMTLTGQVYPIMGGTADEDGVRDIVKAVDRYLFDSSLGGVRLNTDFGQLMPSLGRAFSFAYGEKENGAVFSHMAVMYAYALYRRGFAAEGHRVLGSLHRMAVNFQRSRIFPGIPEYFNNEARGRYHYLTGSASWYVLTLLTQVFGIRGEGGDLRIAPKLDPEQYDRFGVASVTAPFAGCAVKVTYKNSAKVPYARMKIISIQDESGASVSTSQRSDKEVLIPRNFFAKNPARSLTVTLG